MAAQTGVAQSVLREPVFHDSFSLLGTISVEGPFHIQEACWSPHALQSTSHVFLHSANSTQEQAVCDGLAEISINWSISTTVPSAEAELLPSQSFSCVVC